MIQILVSACLTGENCKWDGGNNRNEALLDFMERMKGKAEFHPVCPEQLGGLSTPRPASEVRENDGVVVNTEDRNVTAEFLLGADLALREAKKYGCTIACTGAVDYISDGSKTLKLSRGSSLLPKLVGTGCTVNSLIGACLPVCQTPADAAAAGILAMCLASESAQARLEHPGQLGSFETYLLDSIASL